MANNPQMFKTYFDEIDQWVKVDGKIVTYKYLSQIKEIQVNLVKLILEEYKQSTIGVFDLQSVYLLTGLTLDGNKKVFIVKEEHKDLESERFK